MIKCVKIGSKILVTPIFYRFLSLLAHEVSLSGSGLRTGCFNTVSGYFTGFDRLHAFKARQNAIR